MSVIRSSGVTARQAASKSKPGSPRAASSSSPSTVSTCSSAGQRGRAASTRSRNAPSVMTTRLAASPSRNSICSGDDVL
jgi:hypothetical protein